MRVLSMMVAVALGCRGSAPLVVSSGEKCEETRTPLSATSWAGPTEEDLLDRVAQYAPDHVDWDELTLGEASSSLSFAPVRTAEEAQVVERSGVPDRTCRPGPELLLPVTFDTDIDGGAVTGEVPGTLATPVDGSEIYVDALGPITLAPDWLARAETSFQDRLPGDVIFEWRLGVSFDTWEDGGRIEIEGHGPDSSASMWRGHWSSTGPAR